MSRAVGEDSTDKVGRRKRIGRAARVGAARYHHLAVVAGAVLSNSALTRLARMALPVEAEL